MDMEKNTFIIGRSIFSVLNLESVSKNDLLLVHCLSKFIIVVILITDPSEGGGQVIVRIFHYPGNN